LTLKAELLGSVDVIHDVPRTGLVTEQLDLTGVDKIVSWPRL